MSPAVTSARTPVGVCTSQRYQKEEEGEHGVGGRVEGWLLRMSKILALYFSTKNARTRAQFMLTRFVHHPSLGSHGGLCRCHLESATFTLMAQGLGDSIAPITASLACILS